MMGEVHPDVMDTLSDMKLTAIYNRATGANVTHWELEGLGIIEEARILAAIELWDISNG